MQQEEERRLVIFKDLWRRGFWVTGEARGSSEGDGPGSRILQGVRWSGVWRGGVRGEDDGGDDACGSCDQERPYTLDTTLPTLPPTPFTPHSRAWGGQPHLK